MAAFSKLVAGFRRLTLHAFPTIHINYISPYKRNHPLPFRNNFIRPVRPFLWKLGKEISQLHYRSIPKLQLLTVFHKFDYQNLVEAPPVKNTNYNVVLYFPTPEIKEYNNLDMKLIHDIRNMADQQYLQLMSLSKVLHVLYSLKIKNVNVTQSPRLAINVEITPLQLGSMTIAQWVDKLGLETEFEIKQCGSAEDFLSMINEASEITNVSGYQLRKRRQMKLEDLLIEQDADMDSGYETEEDAMLDELLVAYENILHSTKSNIDMLKCQIQTLEQESREFRQREHFLLLQIDSLSIQSPTKTNFSV
ncbi:hypothetical protein HDV06_005485 [Boothiomyces sp. JEL0866]|nr:hypothetical protein HDV06_005485 [Boothiomyces sp. JEL0866]